MRLGQGQLLLLHLWVLCTLFLAVLLLVLGGDWVRGEVHPTSVYGHISRPATKEFWVQDQPCSRGLGP